MSRRLARLTLDNLSDLPVRCRSCVFWELDPVRRANRLAMLSGHDVTPSTARNPHASS